MSRGPPSGNQNTSLPSPLRSTPHILLKEGDDKSATIIAKLEANNPLASVKVSPTAVWLCVGQGQAMCGVQTVCVLHA